VAVRDIEDPHNRIFVGSGPRDLHEIDAYASYIFPETTASFVAPLHRRVTLTAFVIEDITSHCREERLASC